ncbi:glycoside hydrolase family 92 protein [Mucilaginibacter sp. UR6-1]|uniref:GH92 family glycosyl hydrolase n=1 Tax=Mucilaginibacter sp. UR6-1 TaxID=1435643 RepID=UPI001E464F7E|nr:GH92 family glycosyl hydrolase [Mucilaginibacter sp. UR6-1]MCC8409201.1 glycoside hydrolase family 92 protein [Mucilaginibacter sp. UR6-1]
MKFTYSSAQAAAVILLFATITASAQKKRDYTPLVNTFIGTAGSGHSYPGAATPYGMVLLTPVTGAMQNGYLYTDSTIHGFTHAIYADAAGLPHSEILFMPVIGEPVLSQTKRAISFKKKNEKASVGFYSVELNNKIEAELTATTRAGLQVYDFPTAPKANIVIDLQYGGDVLNSEIEVVNDRELRGFRTSGTIGSQRQTYFYAKFSKPFKTYGIAVNGAVQTEQKKASGTDVKMYVQFDDPGEVAIRTGLSHVSIAGALKNLDAEMPDFDLRKVQKAARAAWFTELGKMEVIGGAPPVPRVEEAPPATYNPYGRPSPKTVKLPDFAALKQNTFYTALYHTMLTPNIASDADGTYSTGNNQTAKAEGYTHYDVSTLNTFGTRYQILTLTDHKRVTDFIKSYQATKLNGSLAFNELIVDALAKGIKGFDVDKAYIQLRTSLDVLNNEGLKQNGFIPADQPLSISKTLYYSYYNWLAAQMAQALKKPQESTEYYRLASSWKNVFNKTTGFFQPKTGDKFREPFKPVDTAAYERGNGWQYTFMVPHDEEALLETMGGKDAFEEKLDSFFGTLTEHPTYIDGFTGQFSVAYLYNNFMPYLYAFTDNPQKTQSYINRIINQLYAPDASGLSGNDYNGQISAWYIMNSLGFYSLVPGGQYYIGLPQFDKAGISLPNNKQFTILNGGTAITRKNFYLQGMNLDKSGYNKLYLNYSDIAKGGDFEVFTGTMANKLFMQDLEKPTSKQQQAAASAQK